MPASYAHYRFGRLALPELDPQARQCIQRFRRMYDMGLQGPDFFFYCNPFLKTAVGDLGNQFHSQSGAAFFTRACAAADSEAARAYLYGLLGHYCLDSVCHPYVEQLDKIGEAPHVALESELERYLMALDKIPSPHTWDRSKKLRLTRGECMSAAAFYPPATGAQVSRGVKRMAFCVRFLSNPRRAQTQKLLNAINPSLCQHLVPENQVEDMAVYIRELKDLYDQALTEYPGKLQQLLNHLRTGEALGADFDAAFD